IDKSTVAVTDAPSSLEFAGGTSWLPSESGHAEVGMDFERSNQPLHFHFKLSHRIRPAPHVPVAKTLRPRITDDRRRSPGFGVLVIAVFATDHDKGMIDVHTHPVDGADTQVIQKHKGEDRVLGGVLLLLHAPKSQGNRMIHLFTSALVP